MRDFTRRHGLPAALALSASALATPALARGTQMEVQIARQGLSGALLAFSRQSGRQILFSPDLVRGKKASALRGRMGVDAALARLLRGSGLGHRETPSGAYLIVPAQTEAAPPDQGQDTAVQRNPASADAVEPQSEETATTEDIVVIGTAGAGIRRQDAAFAVTTIDSGTAQRLGAQSTAEVLRVVPGVSVESSGGKNGANIFVRGYPSGGDAEFVTFQLQGVPFFPPPTLSFLENTQLIRTDETVQRVEAVRGGTGALFSNGQPGLTVNIVQREGRQTPQGLLKLQGTDFGEFRVDSYVSGPVGPRTTVLLGGFYNVADGIRDPDFQAEKGGQLSGNIRHDFDGGSVLVFGRYLDDRGQWLLPIPVVQNGDEIDEFPGFDAGTGTLLGPDTRFGLRNDGSRVDLARGRGAKIGHIGTNVEFELGGGFTVRDRASYLKGDADTFGLVPGGTAPRTAAAYAAGRGGTIGSLTFVTGGAAASPNTQVVEAGQWSVTKDIEAFVNDFALEWKTDRNTLTGGVFYTDYSSRDRWNLGNTLLLTAEPNARRLNLTFADGRVATRDGYVGGSFFNVNASYEGRDIAGYLVDELQITDQFRIDAGVRYQHHRIGGRLENNGSTGPAGRDGDPNTLFDNNDAVLNGTFRTIRYRGDEWSWTVGANYDFSRQVGVFARYSRGNSFPFFDNLRDGLDIAPQVDSYEAGLKVSTTSANLYATVFRNDFEGLATTQILANGTLVPSVGGARTDGVELEGRIGPFYGFSVSGSLAYLDARYRDFFAAGVDLTGNRVQRQPEWQWRITPAYEVEFGDGRRAGAFVQLAYLGDRFSDVQNSQVLPSFYKLDAGLTVDVSRQIQFQVFGDNLTDEIGLTEGNPRTLGSQGSGAIFARPILGRSIRFGSTFRF